jgi:hypothetical protein
MDTLSGVLNGDAQVGSGDFKLKGLLPGIYDLFVRHPDRLAKVPLEIRDADIQDLRIPLEPGVDVQGRIKIAGNEVTPVTLEVEERVGPITFTNGSTRGRFFLTLRSDFVPGMFVARPPVVNSPENSFTIPAVPEGVYSIEIRGTDPIRFYLADVRQDGRSVFDEGLQVSRRPIDSFEVVLGLDGGSVEGTVLTEKNSPVFVVLAPQPSRRQNGSLYKTLALADPSLPIKFSQVAPGLYTVFAFEVEKSGAFVPFRSPDFLPLYETQGVSVKIENGVVVGPVRVPLIGKQR